MTDDDRYRERFLILASYLEQLAPTNPIQFNFRHYATGEPSCVSTACALGFCASIPQFKALGVHLYRSHLYGQMIQVGMPGCHESVETACKLFDISDDEFDFLFIPRCDQRESALEDQEDTYGCSALSAASTAKEVAARLRFFVDHKYGVEL